MIFAAGSQHTEYRAVPGVISGGSKALQKRIENGILVGVPLIGAIISPFWFYYHSFTWIEVSAFAISYAIVGVGVGVGLHRYFSHRSFRTKPWVAWLLGIAGSMAFQHSVLHWVADHRRHHAHTDECGDLHSPYVDTSCSSTSTWSGLFHAHVGWLFDSSVTDYNVFAKDLLRDPIFVFLHRTHWIWPSLLLLSVWSYGYILGGIEHAWGCLLFAGCFRTALFHNIVWAVNSIGHTHGYESFPQKNNSKNNFVLAILTFGEGWHNNHHRFPRSAFHGLSRSEFDINGVIITVLEKLGLATDVIRVPRSKLSQQS